MLIDCIIPRYKGIVNTVLSNLFADPFTLCNLAPQGIVRAFKANYRLVSHT